jgi:HKD family nuclease
MIALIHHPDDESRLGDLLRNNLCHHKWRVFRAAVAFAKISGTKHLCPHLPQFLQTGDVKLSVGIDHKGTSFEALDALLASLGKNGEAYLFHNEAQSTFHPKVYLFANDEAAECFIGSGNLTEGGLFTNCEVFAHLKLDRQNPTDSQLLTGIEVMLDNWSNLALNTVRRLTPELLKELQDSSLVPTEAQMHEAERQIRSAFAPKAATAATSTIFGRAKFRPAPKITGTVRRKPGSGVPGPPAGTTRKVRGFVMTLQRTDVGVGQTTAGTSKRSPEIFIPLAARDAHPRFWGWQSQFSQDATKPGKWDRFGVRMRLGTEIIEVNMMTWPDKHDFRLRNATLRDAGVVEDILRIEEAPAGNPYDYYAEVIPKGSSDYAKYRGICANPVRNSNKRWGYY